MRSRRRELSLHHATVKEAELVQLVVQNAAVIVTDWSSAPILNGWIAISDGKVSEIGTGASPNAPATIDADGCLVYPGAVAAHHHLFQGTSRGVSSPGGLLGWLGTQYRAWARLTPADVESAALASLSLLALGGCTTVASFEYIHPVGSDFVTPVVSAAEKIGLRLLYVRGCAPRLEGELADQLESVGVDLTRLREPEDVALARTREVLSRPQSDRLRWACGPTTPIIDDGGSFQRELNKIADEFEIGIHTHFHPLPGQLADGESAFDFASRLGLIRHGNWFAHGSRLSTNDVAALGGAGVGVVHCPSCSLQLGYDIPPLADWAAANDRVAVSVDGAASNDRGSMLLESQLAWQAQRARFGGAPNLLSANQALDLTTAGGARAINWPELGGLAVGRPADLAIVDFGSIDYVGIPMVERANPAELLMKVYAGAPVRDLIVGERIVLRQGKFASIDLSAVITAANGTAEALHGR